MKPIVNRLFMVLMIFSLLLAACAPGATPEPDAGQTPEAALLPVSPLTTVTGSFTLTNTFVIDTYCVEHVATLTDLSAFVKRDPEMEIAVESQVLGPMAIDLEAPGGSYSLSLPVSPRGGLNDLDNNGASDTGVQVFATEYNCNLYGDVFFQGDDVYRGWPAYLGSVKTDPENEDEIVGGKILVWAPNGDQQFPTAFGADGLLFTADDPAGPLPAGWSVVDLDQDPFAVSQPETADLALYEPPDAAIKDFSTLSYSESFEAMFDFMRREYAFNGIEGKEPDWDAAYAEFAPRVKAAEDGQDPEAFYFAIRDFLLIFKDGHVGSGDPEGYSTTEFNEQTGGGYGFAIRELDDGRVLTIFLTEGGPAEAAGMQVGAEVTEFNGQPIDEAIGEVVPIWVMPISSDFALRYQQARYLLRAPLGTEATVTFTNPGGQPQTVTLVTVNERESFSRTSVYYNIPDYYLVPVESSIITEGNARIGYVVIHANYDDLNLIIRLFERALREFQAQEVEGIIIDMRYNNGGAPLGLAGFLTDQEILIGQSEYYSDATGQFEPEGVPDKIIPNQNQYEFNKVVLLVNQTCYSACEWESYGFSQVPDAIVVGQTPTGGVFAEVARGQISMPDGITVQIPTGRTIMPDGSIFLEGVGVQPTVRVPVDETTIYRTDDYVLEYGIRAVLQPLGAGITPSKQPTLSKEDGEAWISGSNIPLLDDRARETYEDAEYLKVPLNLTYTITLARSETLVWLGAWCAKDSETLKDNLSKMEYSFTLNGQPVPLEEFYVINDLDNGDTRCDVYLLGLKDWAPGEHHVVTTITFKEPVNDGISVYPAGTQVFDYAVFVRP